MVNYQSSYATRTIAVLAAEVGTTLSILAPASVTQGAIFEIYGQLTRDDTGAAIQNASIALSLNGSSLGSAVTDMQGVYRIAASISDPGTYTLRADFAGMTVPGLVLGPSSASRGIGLVEPNVLGLLALAAIVVYAVTAKK